ncbi:MAG: Gfo/Idh/MocA family oxidoreductase [Sphaerochaetaceae bacterium]|nr:Gfo/Idh/MocA family oxidoreductase [Sphaerochaetaceae bacterium]MDY0371728.1 Gfo/Idh/MocA family oxidoreductase [Sphaerochaetaceae bacterium]
MLRIGIMGAGFIGAQHAAAYAQIKDAHLVAIADLNIEAGKKLAKENNCTFYEKAEDMLSKEKLDIVDVCLPTFLHEKYVLLAFKHNVHVLCEKPFTLTYESAEKMVEAAEKAGKTLMVGQVIRFWPEYVRAKEFVDAGELGTIKMVTMSRLAQHPNWSTWHRDPKKSGGGLFDLHIHDVDYMCHLFGDVDQVYAIGEKDRNGCWNHVLSTITFKNGQRAAVEGAFEMTENYPFTMTMRLVGHDASYEYNFIAGFNLENVGGAVRSAVLFKNGAEPEVQKIDETDAYLLELRYFVEQIAKGEPVTQALPRHSLYVMKVMLAIQESLETKQVVKI